MDANPAAQDGVIFLHGIFRTARSMERFRRFVATQGYATLNIDYPSTKMTLAEIVARIEPEVAAFSRGIAGRVHFVGFSMGGLVIRALLEQTPPPNLGRVVMIGTPNHGSEVADFIQHWRLYKRIYGPSGQQLTTYFSSSASRAAPTYELGILAGNVALDPVCNYLIGAPNDGLVSVRSTQLEGMKDHRILRAMHLFFPLHRKAWNHTVHFLQHGCFT